MPDFATVRSGQSIAPSSREWNAMLGAGLDHLNNRIVPLAGPGQRRGKPYSIVQVENNTGGDRLKLEVGGIRSVVWTPGDNYDEWVNNFTLDVELVDTPEHSGRFVIFAEDVASGEIGPAYIDGLFPAVVAMQDENDRFCDVTPGVTGYLESNATGSAELIFIEDTDPAGVQPTECLIKMGGTATSQPFRGQILQQPGAMPGFVQVQPTAYSTVGDVWNPHGKQFPAWYDATELAQGDIVYGGTINGVSIIWSVLCPPEAPPSDGPVNP